ncbi:phage major capsid protein [Pseudoflavonifractor sp. DSM 107456]|uniref:Phage major capsid protein n=1 Tax=Pseudoflavonifractor gallinarum TaxID=2779352 RepID=A0ABR9R9B2_9FIRM|nr:phage major capsid protein [Pseudoflavonifractor gallinarum]MBE5055282.1 phage major capsid protein [Pseudoflavonifractor gallinarum]
MSITKRGKLAGIGLQFFADPSYGADRLAEIEARLAAIPAELEKEGADLDALKTEVRNLKEERKRIVDAAETRKQILNDISSGGGTVVRTLPNQQEERKLTPDTEEYRSLWLRKLQGKELSDVEQRAYTNANGAIAVMTANAIMSVVRDHAPILSRMTVIYSAVNLTYYVEGTNNEAEDHTENASITAAADTLTKIQLVPAEIVKMIQVSEAAKLMSVPAFEAWLAKTLGEAIARKINSKCITALLGSAASAGTAIDTASVQALLGSVKGEITILCNRKTLYTKLLPLQDNSKSSIVRFDGGVAIVYGVEVMPDDNVPDDTVAAGDLSKLIGAMAEDVTVRQGYDIDTNSTKYLGVAVFDVKVGLASAFAKLTAGG